LLVAVVAAALQVEEAVLVVLELILGLVLQQALLIRLRLAMVVLQAQLQAITGQQAVTGELLYLGPLHQLAAVAVPQEICLLQ
jgi:hypothetical protein